jgi:hypothetical protein
MARPESRRYEQRQGTAVLIRSLIKQQESHVGIILVPASFPGDEFALLADAIVQPVATFPRVSPIWFYS